MTLQAAITEAIDRCAGLVEPAPLQGALAALQAPWTVAVVGRTSVGKSTLVNWLAGREASPVGLGGVTREPLEVPLGDRVLIDTPGIDDPDTALLALAPVLDRCDGVIWVIDGLQPLTASERRVAELTLPEGGRVELVIAKADLLEPNERQRVVERVRSLAEGWSPSSLQALDLRAAVRDRLDPGDLARPRPPGARRARIVEQAAAAVREAVAALPPAPSLEGVMAAWRAAVREASASVSTAIRAGEIRHKSDALAALAVRSGAAIQQVQHALGEVGAPNLPSVAVPDRSGLASQMIAGMSGQEGAQRVLKAEAARWLAEGVVALQDWGEDQEPLWALHRDRVALDDALRALRSAIDEL